MGIDEIDLIKPRCVVVNIKHNTLVGLLSDNSKETMLDYLSGLGELSQVQFAFINLSQAHKEAVQTMLPQARIVVHKAHVIKMANDAFNRARKTYRETLTPQQRRGLMHDRVVLLKREQDLTDDEARLLSEWASKHLWIGDAYRVKEEFHKIYDANTPDDAQERFTHWEHSIPPDVRPAFSGLIKVWRTWQPAILAHFDMPASISPSAEHCAECLSGLQDVVGRLGRGYSFEALRAKLLFADDAFMQTAHDDASGKSINYGTGIATLTRMIESGEL
jgi:transposase